MPSKKVTKIDRQDKFLLPVGNPLISLEMLNMSTLMAESAITELKREQSLLSEPLHFLKNEFETAQKMLEESKSVYDIKQAEYDSFEKDIKLKENFIILMNHVKTGKKPKDLTFFEKISNTVGHKPKSRLQKTNVQQIAVRTLIKLNRFCDPFELIEEMLKLDHEYSNIFKLSADQSKSRKKAIAQSLFNSALLIPKYSNRIKLLVVYENKIGLPNWMENGMILPTHATDFINTIKH